MELKETKNSRSSVKVNVTPPSDGHNSNNNRIYDVLFSSRDNSSDQNVENVRANKDYEKATFESISTLDWLKTWRPLVTN